jgi:TM2 domain-containing membrane protein YozV
VNKKKNSTAYILWFACIFGVCGIHRFYLGRYLSGVIWLFTFGFLGIGQLIDLFLIPGMADDRNLINRALSEDIKNDAIRQATLVIAGVQAAQADRGSASSVKVDNAEQMIIDALSRGQSLTFGRICAASGLQSDIVKKQLDNLLGLDIIRISNRHEDGVILYTLQ